MLLPLTSVDSARGARTIAMSLALLALGVTATPLGAQSATADTSGPDLINADRPGIADGSRVIDAGLVQLETAFQQERHTDGSAHSRLSFAPTLFRIGLTSRFEARIESNTLTHERVTTDDGSVERNTGFSPVLLGGKLALYDSKGESRRSLGTIVRVAPPSGTDAFRTMHTTGDIRLAADWDFAPQLSLNPNVGAARLEGSDGETFDTGLGALTLTYQPTERWSPFVDVGYQSREDSGGVWSMILDAGVGYVIGRDVQLDLSAGQGMHGATVAKPFVAAGISVRAVVLHRSGTAFGRTHRGW